MKVTAQNNETEKDMWLLQKALDAVAYPFRLRLIRVMFSDFHYRHWPDRVLSIELETFSDVWFEVPIDFDLTTREEIAIDIAFKVQLQLDQQYVEPEAHICLGTE